MEFRNAVAGTNRSRFEVLSSGAVVLNRGSVGLFVMSPDGVMDELINTGMAQITLYYCLNCGSGAVAYGNLRSYVPPIMSIAIALAAATLKVRKEEKL